VVTVAGTGFFPVSQITFNNGAAATTYVSGTQLKATLTPSWQRLHAPPVLGSWAGALRPYTPVNDAGVLVATSSVRSGGLAVARATTTTKAHAVFAIPKCA